MASTRRGADELAILLALGAIMGVLGPYETSRMGAAPRFAFWILAITGGGLIGISVDWFIGRRATRLWLRIVVTSIAMTPAVAVLVYGLGAALIGGPYNPRFSVELLWQVLVVSLVVTTLRVLAWRRPTTIVETRMVVETRTVVAPPLPEAEATFRRRLSARRRGARLIAVQAEDHYLRIHTDAGDELLTLRFMDALEDLSRAPGFRTHRSWWVAADAIEEVKWRKGLGEARLTGGLVAPISRTQAPILKQAGWF